MYTTIGLIAALFLVGVVVMNNMTRKGYLNELEAGLELKEFKLDLSWGQVVVNAIWKGMPFQINAHSRMMVQLTVITYATDHRFDFSGNITPGPGLLAPSAGAQVKKASEEEALRPWRVKLTAEEQKIIDERRGSEAPAEVSLNKFVVRSNKADVTAKYVQNREHSEALEALFKEGVSEVRFSAQGLVLVKNSYDNNDMLPKRVEKYLSKMKALIN